MTPWRSSMKPSPPGCRCEQYGEQKYKFAAESARRQAEAAAAHDAEVGQKAVNKYKEDNPVTRGNPGLANGIASRHPHVFKPRTAAESNDFRKMSPRERIAASVTRVREAIAASGD